MKKYLKTQITSLASAVGKAGQSAGHKAYKGLRLKARSRLINRWGQKHPKIVFTGFFTMMFLCFGMVFLYSSKHRAADQTASDLLMARQYLESSANIRAMEANTRQTYEEVLDRAIACGQELDSLIHIPEKTPRDSQRITILSQQFQIYKKALDNEEN